MKNIENLEDIRKHNFYNRIKNYEFDVEIGT